MSLRFYQPYSPIKGYVVHETTSIVKTLPIPITIVNSALSGVSTVHNLITQRFTITSKDGILQSINGFSPINGFVYFIQGIRYGGDSNINDIYVQPGSVLEIVSSQ